MQRCAKSRYFRKFFPEDGHNLSRLDPHHNHHSWPSPILHPHCIILITPASGCTSTICRQAVYDVLRIILETHNVDCSADCGSKIHLYWSRNVECVIILPLIQRRIVFVILRIRIRRIVNGIADSERTDTSMIVRPSSCCTGSLH